MYLFLRSKVTDKREKSQKLLMLSFIIHLISIYKAQKGYKLETDLSFFQF